MDTSFTHNISTFQHRLNPENLKHWLKIVSMPRFCSLSPLKWHWMHPIRKASRKILTFKYYNKFAFIQIRDSMGAHLIFFIIFTLFSCIILTNQSLPWYSLRSGFQCDTKMAAVFSCMKPTGMTSHLAPPGASSSHYCTFCSQYPHLVGTLSSTHHTFYTTGTPVCTGPIFYHFLPHYVLLPPAFSLTSYLD